jgi:hypothetical protein
MTDDALRQMVRDAVAREIARSVSPARSAARAPLGVSAQVGAPFVAPLAAFRHHVSHAMLEIAAGAEAGGACLIEPSVACNHCGYCKSYGC